MLLGWVVLRKEPESGKLWRLSGSDNAARAVWRFGPGSSWAAQRGPMTRGLQSNCARQTGRWGSGVSVSTEAAWKPFMMNHGSELPGRLADQRVEEVITKTLESMPKKATHWSTRGLAQQLGMSQSSISRIWRAFGLQPHRSKSFSLSQDPQLIEKVRDIVGLYMEPPVNAVVLCVDEKGQIQALQRSQPLLPMRPGQVERRTHDYMRPN